MGQRKWSMSATTMLNTLLMLSVLGSLPSTSASPLEARETSVSAAPTLSFQTSLPHTPFTGTPSTTGALTATSIGTSISEAASVAPAQTTYPSDGKLHQAEPAPYEPAGGVGLNGSIPVYNAKSDFDYESLALALYQEWMELDMFQDGLRRFTAEDFNAAGLNDADRDLIQFMADQKIGAATLLSNMLGAEAPKQCQYNYPYTTVLEFLDFCQKITGVSEAMEYNFLTHLDSREAATLLLQTIATGARQQMIFRQLSGLFPMPVWFEAGVPQSWAWTLLAPYIASCPSNQTRLIWQNYPTLRILNEPSLYGGGGGSNSSNFNNTITPGVSVVKSPKNVTANSTSDCGIGVTPGNYTRLSFPGRQVSLQWDTPGKPVGPNNSYVTSTQAGKPKYVAWVSQLNITYTPLRVAGNRGYTIQPDLEVYQGDPLVNGTTFIAVTDSDLFVTPYNLSMINPHVVAGPALYQAG